MSFGGQTVALVAIAATGSPGYQGIKATSRTKTVVSGVHFRPFQTLETPDTETDVATELWKLTAPPETAALVAKSTGELLYDGTDDPADVKANRFAITGPVQPKSGLGAKVHHVTIMCKRQVG